MVSILCKVIWETEGFVQGKALEDKAIEIIIMIIICKLISIMELDSSIKAYRDKVKIAA